MIWFLIIVGLLIFAPMLLVVAMGAVILVAIPFIVFFVVAGLVVYVVLQVAPDSLLLALALGFVAGIVAARALVLAFIRARERPL